MTDTLVDYLETRRNAVLDKASAAVKANSDPTERAAEVDTVLQEAAELESRVALARSRVVVKSEPLTYRPDVRASYFQDLGLAQLGRVKPEAQVRLQRHAKEMTVLAEKRNQAAREQLDRGGLQYGFEYRVEANTTDGLGGYFSPPAWLISMFASGRHAQRPLADLIPGRFALPPGVSSINIPIISTGAQVHHVADTAALPDQDIVDTSGTSYVAELAGLADWALQDLEMSPPGAHLDWAIFQELTKTYDADLELQLINGSGAYQAILGLANVTGGQSETYTSGSPTGSGLWPYLGYVAAQIGDTRLLPPEVWLMRTARWGWLNAAEDTANRPFGLPSPFFLGNDDATPDPVGGLLGWPVFLDDAIPATYNSTGSTTIQTGTEDMIFCVRPSDMLLFEGTPRTDVFLEPGSATLSARFRYRNYAAAIVGRYAAGVGSIGGTGLTVQANY